MAIEFLGVNTQEQFERNANRFQYCDELNVYKQTLCPVIDYTNDRERAHPITDTFAFYAGENNYIVFKYKGSNFIEDVQREIREFIQHSIG